ncbi:STAS domain-containing protein [Bacillus sp. ISL-35]|uniref:STAS domain-containing protein n=1 Tax=Bacillus sp. ISL-35 TaxID=2819122 RepID=UPI001BE76B18|nr:STAS domain-containing protein [Bacillus sp. ISL-35]MBT2680071.1 STAS domain-containing protein [Bacillus sp. ISL-35]MBT2702952.1 STAS domain-containing protein [Chryseobacterium sp. ISL-80]
MLGTINNLANHLNSNSANLALDIVNDVLNKMDLHIPKDEKNAAISMYENLIIHLAGSLTNETLNVPVELIEWSRRNSEALINSETHISEITVRYPPTREVFADFVTDWTNEFNLDAKEAILVIRQFNKMLDISLEETISTYERISEQLRLEALKEIEELSSPLVPVKAGVVVLPLIGNIDSVRTNHLMLKVVPKISELKVNYLIADFSGVSTINEQMARNLHQIGGVLKLLGIKVLTTGISPRLAQTAVNSGIDLSKTTAFHNVKQALDWLDKLDDVPKTSN